MIYAELIDPNSGANNSIVLKSHNLPNITIELRASSLEITSDHDLTVPGLTEDELYSNDIVNMQNELKAGLTVENFEYLPLSQSMHEYESPTSGLYFPATHAVHVPPLLPV